jgi:adenylate cyclase
MGIEIERKFLAKPDCINEFGLEGQQHLLIQGYLSTEPTVRVRIDMTSGEGFLTIKGRGHVERSEYEYPIPKKDAEELLEMCPWGLSKHRYTVMYHGKKWVIDNIWFDSGMPGSGTSLWLTEIELESVDEHFDMPPWVLKEVTNNPRYTNASLARIGPP